MDVQKCLIEGKIPIRAKLQKVGNSYYLRVDKALINFGILKEGREISASIELDEKPYKGKRQTQEDASVAKRFLECLLNHDLFPAKQYAGLLHEPSISIGGVFLNGF